MSLGATQSHHHRSTIKVNQKSFKPRFASKNALRDQSKGRTEALSRGSGRSTHQQVMSKFDRRNQAKQRRLAHHQDQARSSSIFGGKDGAAKIVAVVPLCGDADSVRAVQSLNASLEIDTEVSLGSNIPTYIDRFKQNLQYLCSGRDLFQVLDTCRVADYVLFVMSSEKQVDEHGKLLLRSIENQGIPTAYTAVQGLDRIEPPKRKPQIVSSLKSFMLHFLPEQEKVFSLDSFQECQNVIRSFCTNTSTGIRWRDNRSWMLVENARFLDQPTDANAKNEAEGNLILTGVVRGQNLKADRLIHLGDWGNFQIERIWSAASHLPHKGKHQQMQLDYRPEQILDIPSGDQDPLDKLAPQELVMEETGDDSDLRNSSKQKGVLLDDQYYYSENNDGEEAPISKRLPRGTSKYQSAWYVDDISDSGSDLEDVRDDEQGPVLMEDLRDLNAVDAGSLVGTDGEAEVGPSQPPHSETGDENPSENDARDYEAYRAKKKAEAEEDKQFPDEIELPPDVPARERLAKYRGLKSFKTSTWSIEDDKPYEPREWNRLLDISDYKGARNKVMHESLVGGVKPGTRVNIEVRNVPYSAREGSGVTQPLSFFSLLRHEHKWTATNFSISLSPDEVEPIKAKEEMIIQYGPHRLVVNPLFSQLSNTPNDVHKFERFLHPGRTAVASFTGPLVWGSVPALFFKRRSTKEEQDEEDGKMDTSDSLEQDTCGMRLVGRGSSLAPSTSRVIAKRIVLTGQAYKINRRLTTVRYMFFNAEDVAWFKALQLWTNRGRQGNIKESLGTHGYFKAMFDQRIGMQDAIGMSLYKRVWPRAARPIEAEQ